MRRSVFGLTVLTVGQHVERSGLDVDNRSGGDADFRSNKRTLHHVF